MRIEYQYSDQEKQIIEGQNLTHTIEEIPPPFTGGQMAGVLYQATAQQAFISNGTFQNWGTEYRLSHTAVSGAIFQIELLVNGIVDEDLEHWSFRGKGEEPLTNGNTSNSNYSLKFNGDPAQIYFIGTTPGFKITGLARIDGQPDTGGNLPTTYKFTVYENGTEIYRETRFEVPIIATIVVDYLKFAEERLELGIDYGAVGGMRFNTTILETGNGGQQRNANWWLPLGRWQLGERTLLESQQDKIAEVTYLKEFHAARRGSLEGFRFKDWSDYQIIDQEIGIGDGIETEYQLKKTYYAGSASCARPITKPVEGTVRIFVGYAEQITGWSVDYTSGLIRFDNPPPISAVIKVTCEFDVPVWFEGDAIGWRLEGYQEGEAIYRLESVFVEEGRIPIPKLLPIQPLPDLSNEILDLGIIYNTIETIEYQTSKQKLASGYVRRDDNYPAPTTKINLGDRILDRAELDNLLGFFWCAKGKNSSFWLQLKNKNYYLNFAQDQLNLKFEIYENSDYLFNLTNLNFNQNPAFAFLSAIIYQYSDEEKQIIGGQNLTYTIETIPPSFTGGQMQGVLYNVDFNYDFYSIYDQATIINRTENVFLNLNGAITSLKVLGFPGGNGIFVEVVFSNGQQTTYSSNTSVPVTSRVVTNSVNFIVYRMDGQPDTGGDPPSTYKFTIYEDGTEIYTSTRSQIPLIS